MVGALGAVLVITKDWKRVWKDWLGLVVIFSADFSIFCLVSGNYPDFYDRYLLSAVAGVSVLLVLGTRKQFLGLGVGVLLVYGFLSWNVFTNPQKGPLGICRLCKNANTTRRFLVELEWKGTPYLGD